MKTSALVSASMAVGILALAGCQTATATQKAQLQLDLGAPLLIRPKKLPTGGGGSYHACLRGQYSHQYRLDSEVWLCCVPINELLSSSFDCAAGVATLLGGEYMKVRYCLLEAHPKGPTAREPEFVPVCVPAALKAPQ
jgi:hypothetical protein